MKKNLPAFLCIVVFAMAACSAFAQFPIVVNLKLLTIDGKPLQEKEFLIQRLDKVLIQKCITDHNGCFTTQLTRGLHASIVFENAGFNYIFKLEVPPDPELNVYQKTCKITTGQKAMDQAENKAYTSKMTLIVQNDARMPLAGQYVSVYNENDLFITDVKTDQEGKAFVPVNKNETYKLVAIAFGHEHHASFTVASTDWYSYYFIIPEKR